MKLRVLVEVVGGVGGKPRRKMTTIEISPKRTKFIESFHGDGAIDFILDEALTGATGAFQAQKKTEVVNPAAAPKEKLEEVLGLGIIEEMDRKERSPVPGGGQALAPLPRAPQIPMGNVPVVPRSAARNPMGPGPVGFGPHRHK